MKASSIAVALVLGLLLSAGTAKAEQAGAISDDVLAQMGLGGMEQVSDEAGMDIRGKGWGGWGWGGGRGGWGGWGWGGHGWHGGWGWHGGFSKYEVKISKKEIKIKIKR